MLKVLFIINVIILSAARRSEKTPKIKVFLFCIFIFSVLQFFVFFKTAKLLHSYGKNLSDTVGEHKGGAVLLFLN